MMHVLYYPDGNRRYAKNNNISLHDAYILGGRTLRLVSEFFLCRNLAKELTYLGSCQHTQLRDDGSFPVIYEAGKKTLEELVRENFFRKNGIKFTYLHHGDQVPKEVIELCEELRRATQNHRRILRALFDYSLIGDEQQAYIQSGDYEDFRKHRQIPNIHLALRQKEIRASNGPVYAMGQTQWIELPVLNPELTWEHLEDAWLKYQELLRYRRTTNPVHR